MHFMKSNIYLVLVMSLLLLVHANDTDNQGSTPVAYKIKRDCSTELSNKVRIIVENIIIPTIQTHQYNLPSSCPFNLENDMLLPLTRQMIRTSEHWKCRSCSKQFRNEEFLDQHLKNNHANLIPDNATICLGDYCEILNCNNENIITCDERKMERLKYSCQGLIYNCFPPSLTEESKKLYNHFDKSICSHLTCSSIRRNNVGDTTSNSINDLSKQMNEYNQSKNQWSVMKYVGAVVTIMVLVLFYLVLCFYKRETSLQKDLKSLTNKRHKDLLKRLEKKNF